MNFVFEKIFDSDEKLEKIWLVKDEKKSVCQLKGFHRYSRDFFGHFCIVEFLFNDDEKSFSKEFFAKILNFVEENFYCEFSAGTIAFFDYGDENLKSALSENQFVKSNRLYLNKFDGYWVKQAVHNKFTVIPFTKNVLHITDGSSSFSTVIKGNQKALVIDTLWGTTDYSGLLKKILKTPYEVVNSHGHPDHSFGNVLFDSVKMNLADEQVYAEITDYFSSREEKFFSDEDRLLYRDLKLPPVKILEENEIFDLGGITVQTVSLGGHTKGSAGFFVKEQKILVGGDAVCPQLWLFMKESLSVEEALKNYEKILSLDFENVISSHMKIMHPRKLAEVIVNHLKNILDGKINIVKSEIIMGYNVVYSEYQQDEIESQILLNADEIALKKC